MARSDVLKAIAVTAELCGRMLSEGAARVFADDLMAYPEHQVMSALVRCRKEVRGALTVADVISRIDDGRPGVEEAWAMMPRDEASSCVWTEEMAEAFGTVQPLMSDEIAARMAFKEVYSRLLAAARDKALPVRWIPSLGHDAGQREQALQLAVRKGRITSDYAQTLLPAPAVQIDTKALEYAGGKLTTPEDAKRKVAALMAFLAPKR